MKVSFRLSGTRQGQPVSTRFTLKGVDGKEPEDQRVALDYFQESCNIRGLRCRLYDDGLISLMADDDQLNPDVVATIRRHAETALATIS